MNEDRDGFENWFESLNTLHQDSECIDDVLVLLIFELKTIAFYVIDKGDVAET